MNQIGSRIKKLRVFKGLTQEEVASKLYLSVKAYQNVEHGVTRLDVERMKQLADIFEINAIDLIDEADLEIKFERIAKNKTEVHNNANYTIDSETYMLLLKEKDNEIAFLRELLDKLLS